MQQKRLGNTLLGAQSVNDRKWLEIIYDSIWIKAYDAYTVAEYILCETLVSDF